ncbi:DNA-binding NarL/FixJ family response regulator [Paraburkholderia bannensis]|uniref:DNA-binding NarL/FixJ family response regulator n=1 Tax=Paraburkholderia bannensis TaxID=765414 RepID=A0A7W9TTQ8_9BURK|nr:MULTISPECIES: response regulator transcription factor [Paraburkholderia]MBB3256311.1 DNA-binding NarL/FixJ family response regulator [Paraburkholderia sp. WP4_3_2]MBB6101311.1 DNA-binding NarL/FixJ family response regulator [Paraburkholderia bannensis]
MKTPSSVQAAVWPAKAGAEPNQERGAREPTPNDADSDAAQPAQPLRLLVADDHPLVLFALDNLIAAQTNMRIVARAQTMGQLFEIAAHHAFDLVLMDLHMPSDGCEGGHEAIRAFQREHAGKPVVVLTMDDDAKVLRGALDLDVGGLLSKRDRIDLIPVALASAMVQEQYVGPSVRDLLERASREERRAHVHRVLSRREYEVLSHYATGLGVTGIARLLGRSVKTISAQKCAAMKKLALSSDIELYRFAVECGVVPPEDTE